MIYPSRDNKQTFLYQLKHKVGYSADELSVVEQGWDLMISTLEKFQGLPDVPVTKIVLQNDQLISDVIGIDYTDNNIRVIRK